MWFLNILSLSLKNYKIKEKILKNDANTWYDMI